MKNLTLAFTAALALGVSALAQSSGSSGASSSSSTASPTGASAGNSITTPTTNPSNAPSQGASTNTTSGAWVDRPAPGTPQTTPNTSTQATVITPQGTTETLVTTPGLVAPADTNANSTVTTQTVNTFSALDRDGDGLVTLAEYGAPRIAARRQAEGRAAVNNTTAAASSTQANRSTNAADVTSESDTSASDSAAITAQFQQLDVNRDGLLTRDELNGTVRTTTRP